MLQHLQGINTLREAAIDVLGVASIGAPLGIGLAFGIAKLVLDSCKLPQEIHNMRIDLLRKSLDLLVLTELGETKLPKRSIIDPQKCQKAIEDSITLCCRDKW